MMLSSFILPSSDAPFISSNTIDFNNSSFEIYKLNNQILSIKSNKGNLNLDNQDFNFIGNVEGKFIIEGDTVRLKTESLSGNLIKNSISSEEKVLFEVKGLEIISRSMEIIQVPQKELKILFKNANFSKINSISSVKKGKANKIELFPSKDLIFMEGNAELHEDNMKIISDEIHYDLSEDRILKSLNAKIINNL